MSSCKLPLTFISLTSAWLEEQYFGTPCHHPPPPPLTPTTRQLSLCALYSATAVCQFPLSRIHLINRTPTLRHSVNILWSSVSCCFGLTHPLLVHWSVPLTHFKRLPSTYPHFRPCSPFTAYYIYWELGDTLLRVKTQSQSGTAKFTCICFRSSWRKDYSQGKLVDHCCWRC